jgi:hypothetical protein
VEINNRVEKKQREAGYKMEWNNGHSLLVKSAVSIIIAVTSRSQETLGSGSTAK